MVNHLQELLSSDLYDERHLRVASKDFCIFTDEILNSFRTNNNTSSYFKDRDWPEFLRSQLNSRKSLTFEQKKCYYKIQQ